VTLHIADNLELPIDAVVQTFAVLAKRGAGKTYTTLVMVEEMLKTGLQVVIADPIGVTWGLRASADGKSPGLPIVVFGGDHGDIPLEVTAGQLIADLVVDERLSAVLDLSRLRKGEQVRFMTDFAEQLYHRNRNPLHLVLDEADAFAPQRPLPGQQRMLGAVEDLVRRGRARGLGVSLVTQRSAVLNKDVLTQVEVLVALRTIAPQDRAAIDEWIKVHGTPEQREQLMSSLPSLPIGEAWFWSPGWLDLFQRVQVRKRETFDSSATPEVGKKIQAPKRLADVDLAAISERMSATIERAKADDPRELRKRIAELERQVRARPAETKTVEVEKIVEVPVLAAGQLQQLDRFAGDFDQLARVFAETVTKLTAALHAVNQSPSRAAGNYSEKIPRQPVPRIPPVPQEHKRPATALPPAPRPESGVLQTQGSETKILDVLATLEALGLPSAHRAVVAAFSGYSHKGGRFQNLLGGLRTKGLIAYPTSNQVALTDAARELGAVGTRPGVRIASLDDLHQAWYDQVGTSSARILRELVGVYPDALAREELADRTGYQASGGRFQNILGSLRTLQLIEYPNRGQVVATELLFPALPGRAR
jgi:uncharacterized protein